MPEYPGHFLVKKVTTGGTFTSRNGCCTWRSRVDQHGGLEETDDGCGDPLPRRARDRRRARLAPRNVEVQNFLIDRMMAPSKRNPPIADGANVVPWTA